TSKLNDIHGDKIENIADELKQMQENLPLSKDLKLNIENTNLHAGKILVTAKDINFGYNSLFLWENPLNFQIRSGDRIAIPGNNGAGKSTLIKLILGKLEPQTGTLTKIDFSSLYIDQEYSIINDKLTVYEQIQQYNEQYLEHELKMFLHRFLFTSDTWDKPCGKLSGGEKMKLLFCCLQVNNKIPDVFVLDEPTNNLDIKSLEVVTSVVKSYQGTILLISHDRYFIDEIGINKEIMLL
ncbi:ATP-binding cassette domain-containing protein, partial [Bacteroidales bacterium OttesenSCG-928-I21]|nr:ATP-binding cassette domain-containing protein [Bacteroidales bacterium OttesenSCG-928-I21]